MREAGQHYLMEKAHRLLLLPDLLGYALTGEAVTEYTLAAETQMLDWETRDWIDDILNAYSIPRTLFAPLAMPGTVTGRGALDGIPAFDFVSVCEHDTASAFLASPLGANAAILSSGTWSLVGVEHPSPVISEAGFRWNIANEGSLPGHHRILRNVMGSWLLQELQRDFAQRCLHFDFDRMQAEALAAEPFEFLLDPDDARFYYPGGMAGKIGEACREKCGRAPETPGEFFRLVYESLALKYRLVLERIEALTGRRVDAVNIVGGGSRDALGAQFTANALGRRVVAGPADATSIGNILVQMLAHGDISSIEEGRALIAASFETREYLPEEAARWQAQYERFVEAFGLNRKDPAPQYGTLPAALPYIVCV
jgi:sugar (pentulose or hexulose) kinase